MTDGTTGGRPIPKTIDETARRLVQSEWGIFAPLQRVDIGVNKSVWRTDGYWLASTSSRHVARVEREHALYATLASRDGAFDVPKIHPSRVGTYVTADDRIWWMTTHVPGRPPDPASEGDGAVVAAGLARLHSWLSPVEGFVEDDNVDLLSYCRDGQKLVRELPFAREEQRVIAQASEFVDQWLRAQPIASRQVVHGDPSFPNLRLSEERIPSLSGCLDWERCRLDSVISDVATCGEAVAFRSGTNHPKERLQSFLASYQEAGGKQFTLIEVIASMIMANFESISHHGERFLRSEGTWELLAFRTKRFSTELRILREEC